MMWRHLILRRKRLDILAQDVLGYTVKPFHRQLMDFTPPDHETPALQLAPRGFGKSTVVTITRSLYEIIRNPNIRILIASNTQIQAEIFLREIKHHITGNARFKEVFGELRGPKWHETEVIVSGRASTAKESTITCVGVGGAVASRHYDVIFFDDLVDEENARTEHQRNYVKTWYYKTLLPCLEPDGYAYGLGTRYHPLDLYGHLIKNECAESHQVLPPWDAWPEKFSREWLERRRCDLGTAIFNSQYENNTDLMKGNIFKEEWFRFYDEDPLWEGDAARDVPRMQHFIGCDPAATKKSMLASGDTLSSDWWTIVVGASQADVAHGDSNIYVREVWRSRCTKDEYLMKLRDLNTIYKPTVVCIENVAAQEYLAQDAERYMPVHRVERAVDKVARAYWLQPFIENGQIWFPRNDDVCSALQDELILFPNSEHDDLFDGLQTMVDGCVQFRSNGLITEPIIGRSIRDEAY